MSDWTTPAELTRQLAGMWEKGRILAASVTEAPMFPISLRLRKPENPDFTARFDDVRAWIRDLEQGSKSARGFGYEIEWIERDLRQLGRNRLPAGIRVGSEEDALRLIGKQREAARFRGLLAATLSRFPALREWLGRFPLLVLEYSGEWEGILAVLEAFRAQPRSGRYLRELDIPGVDTKFIEDRKGILAVLLDQVLPAAAIDGSFVGARNFEARYGLRDRPPLVRFRILDRDLVINGLSDISAPAREVARLDLAVRQVFIAENETSGIAFPDVPESLVVFGLGYSIDLLAGCEWLKATKVFYWGDIDTHGFAILDRLRAFCPEARSLLMDRETLMAHRRLWVTEATPHDKALERLNDAERVLYDDLRHDRLGARVRLEQERIGFRFLQGAIAAL